MKTKFLFLLTLILYAYTAFGQSRSIKGTVTSSTDGAPLIGVNVIEVGTTNGVVTDFDGNYSLNVNDGAVLEFSFMGFITQRVAADKESINVVLVEDAKALEEVVVVGYGVQKKKLVTGATLQVDGDDIAKLNTTSALTALQSQTPGVQITQSSAQPGKGFKVYIRGIGTIGSSDPLYVIDGVSGGNMDNINPADIESIDVLKDAASAAIYGARAANGVILVTTKQGKAGKTQVSYDGFVGVSNAYKKPSLLNAQQYMAIVDEYNFNVSGEKTKWTSLIPAEIYQKIQDGWTGTDWWDTFENKNAMQMNHALNITGGNDRSKFSLGFSYTGNEGIMGAEMPSDYDRYTTRINSEHILLKGNDRDIITFGENVSFYYNRSHDLAETNMYWNTVHDCFVTSPLVPVYAEDGSIYNYDKNGTGWDAMIFSNPYERLKHGGYNSMNESRNFGIGATAYLIVEPIKNLKYRGQFNVDYSSNSSRNYTEPSSANKTGLTTSFSLGQNMSHGSNISVENTISYKLPEIAGNNIDILVGQSFQKMAWGSSLSASNSASQGSEKATLLGWDYAWMSNMNETTASTSISGTPWNDSSLASFFGRLNWNYKEKYMATATIRTDGSSNFKRGNRWGTFPSASAGWVVSNEGFMDSTKSFMDFLKIRASWGQNGNCNIDNFQYISMISYSGSNNDNAYKFGSTDAASCTPTPVAGAFIGTVINEDVTWETSEQIDLGIDARFLDSRLGFTFDWYKKQTKDWLIQAPIPTVMGAGAPYVNGGDVENKGFEISFTWNDQIGDDFKYHASLNVAHNKNEVTRIANGNGYIEGAANILAQTTDPFYRAEVGKPIGYFYAMETAGVWQNQAQIDAARTKGQAVLDGAQPGDLIWVDYNGDGKINNDTDRHEIGNPNPDYTMGLSFGVDYKGFDLNVTTFGAFGQQIMKNYRGTFVTSPYENYTTEIFNRWHGEGTSNSQPRLCSTGHTNNVWISDRYMEDGDFLKIQNVTLGYNFNKIWKNSPFQQLRLYVQGQNLYTFTKYSGCDPEVGSSAGNDGWASGIDLGLYPSARTFIVGASIKF